MARIEYHKQKKHSGKWLIGGLIGALLLIASSVFFMFYPFASQEKKTYFEGGSPILFNGQQAGNAIVEGGTVFLPLDFLKENIDGTVLFDEKSKSVIITTKDKVVQMPTDSLTYFVNEKPVNLQISPIISRNGQVFAAIDPLLPFYSIQYIKMPDTGAIWIQKDGDEYKNGKITEKDINKEKLRLRVEPSWRSPYTADISRNEDIMIEGEKEDFFLVRKTNGISGYIKKDYVKPEETIKISIVHESKSFPVPTIKGQVQLTWEAVYTKNPNAAQIPDMPGINVVSPTWFSLAGEDGSIKNLASLEYSQWAQGKGYQVWGVFSNSFDPDLTNKALKDFETRQTIIRQLLHFSQIYQLQGINFDIENVYPEDGPLVTQFMREAAPYLHEAGLVVSMDITFAGGENNNWSSFYDRPKLAEIVDYLIVMAYDEHTGATDAGSVSSLPWVERNLQGLLAEVPNEKLMLGVPLYARLWKEQTNAEGMVETTAKALTMEQVKAWIDEKGVQPIYDPESGQNYVEYTTAEENATYRIWIEDELSLKKRTELVVKYGLAGIGSWSRFFGNTTAWTALDLNSSKEVTQN